ncbi:RND transporter [Enterococcus ureilyticus]|uniref:RND transporter n=1 Tax=Enterococcus ureilyticus TaxID=1131292 RepID=A0A1E5HCJ5_9ENTE|nr:RND transporter [Enterococcus ureilyticus]MBM7687832.1 HlyD family secretion protein [Enterococcus ureilyticus]MBO0447029.1 efflux RND transporter periplasmic adaptor subunit [Enterococcus ureilyticus]OEG22667.1 RND transporter [Enterococcus ureilyticus]
MKKRTMIIVGVIAVVCIGIFVLPSLLGGNKKAGSEKKTVSEDLGIEYFDVPDIEQVYINGVIQPEQAEAFAKDSKMTSTPEIKVKNGDVVEPETELFTYEDKEVTKEIEAQNNTLSKLATKKQNIYNKWNRAIDNFNKAKEEERNTTGAAINEQHQAEIDGVDEEILFSNETIADLTTKQFISTKAKFKGRVSIPEVKDENAPVLRLTSDGLYVAGKVNEKDLMKIAVDQKANLSVVSSGTTVTGKISYIDDNPPEAKADQGENTSGEGTMSTYNVKLALDSLGGIKNGYHMQATINIGDNKPIEVPKKAIHEQDGKKYVLVNDFGSVIRRDVQVGEEKEGSMVINSGLESADRIIVSSKKDVKEGDLIEEDNQGSGEAAPAAKE